MKHPSSSVFLAGTLVLALATGAHAQGTQQGINARPAGTSSVGTGVNSGGGTGVTTGRGPLAQPVAPATSTFNNQRNLNSQRPLNLQGPAQTNPGQDPFGSR